VTGEGSVSVADALAALRYAVRGEAPTSCLACLTETTIGPEGGQLVSRDGVVIDFPPGALSSPTTVSIKGLPNGNLPTDAAKVYDVEPDGLPLAIPAPVSATLPWEAHEGEIGAEVRFMIGSKKVANTHQLVVLENPSLFIDADSRTAVAGADFAYLGHLAISRTGMYVTVRGVPDSAGVGETQTLTVELTSDNFPKLSSAAYTDSDSAVWAPSAGPIASALLPGLSPTHLAEDFAYRCTDAGSGLYAPAIEIVYDVQGIEFQAIGAVNHTTIRKTIACHP